GLRVPHRAFARAGNLAQGVWGDFYLLLVGDVAQAVCYLLRGDGSELELLAAREDGFGNLVRVRRRHDEEDARGRLFQSLQQGVEGGGREHVDFVNDEDLVAVTRGPDAHGVDDSVAHVVHARVR